MTKNGAMTAWVADATTEIVETFFPEEEEIFRFGGHALIQDIFSLPTQRPLLVSAEFGEDGPLARLKFVSIASALARIIRELFPQTKASAADWQRQKILEAGLSSITQELTSLGVEAGTASSVADALKTKFQLLELDRD